MEVSHLLSNVEGTCRAIINPNWLTLIAGQIKSRFTAAAIWDNGLVPFIF